MEIQFYATSFVITGDEGRVSVTLGKHQGSSNGKPYYLRRIYGAKTPPEQEFAYLGQAVASLATMVSALWARESVRAFLGLPATKKQSFLIQIMSGEI